MSDKIDPADEDASVPVDPAGDQLGDELPDPGDYVVVDDEAEELADADAGIVDDDTLDDQTADDQTADDEAVEDAEPVPAVAAVRRNRPKRKAVADDVVIDDDEQLTDAEDEAADSPSTKPVKRSARSSGAGAGRSSKPSSTKGSRRDAKGRAVTKAATNRAGGRRVAPVRRTTPVGFVGQSVTELRKVMWPTGDQLGQYFVVVLVFVLLIIAYVGGLDLLFGWVLIKLLGQ